jgi:uncharacterized protein
MHTIIDKLPKDYSNTIDEVVCLFNKVDEEVRHFVGLTGISCPPGCGYCCNSLKIETTILEMLPLAVHLWARDKANDCLLMLAAATDARCVFFHSDPEPSGNGHCCVYELRPLICRLFGFFTVKDKYGKYVYGSCKIIKQVYPDAYKKAENIIRQNMHPSNMTDFAIRILAQGSDMGRTMLPINIALKSAIEKIGFILSLTQTPPSTPKPKAA